MKRRLLIRTPNHLGDCIMALPMINEVREVYPGSTVTLLSPQSLAPLFNNLPSIDAVVSIPDQYVHGLKGVLKVQGLIQGQGFNTAYVLPPSFGSAAAVKLASVPERIGYISDGRRLLLTRPLAHSHFERAQHRCESYVDLLRRGADCLVEYTQPKLLMSDEDDKGARDLLSQFGVSAGQQFVVVACQAVAESRRWGLDRYAALVDRLTEETEQQVVLIGAHDERSAGESIMAMVRAPETVKNLAGRTSVRELAAVLSRARLFVGNDSGSAHVSAAVSTPIVVLSGADDPHETSPQATRKALIYCGHLECISCVKNVCPLSGDQKMRCMRDITVAQVFRAAMELLEAD